MILQERKIGCDICGEPGDRYPSWFRIERYEGVTTAGWKRYDHFVDLCPGHEELIIQALKAIYEGGRPPLPKVAMTDFFEEAAKP